MDNMTSCESHSTGVSANDYDEPNATLCVEERCLMLTTGHSVRKRCTSQVQK